MQVQKIQRGVRPAGNALPRGAFAWATVQQLDDRESGRIKCCCLDGEDIYTASQLEGVRKWNATSGRQVM